MPWKPVTHDGSDHGLLCRATILVEVGAADVEDQTPSTTWSRRQPPGSGQRHHRRQTHVKAVLEPQSAINNVVEPQSTLMLRPFGALLIT